MKKSLFLLLLFLATSSAYSESDSLLVLQCFENYREALTEEKGDEAVKYLDSNTIRYYEDILEKTIYLDSTRLANEGLMDKLMIILLRAKIPKEEILKMDGKSLIIYSINNGMTGTSSIRKFQIGTVIVVKDHAEGFVISNEKTIPIPFRFNKENGAWKLDITSILKLSEMGITLLLQKKGMTEEDFIKISIILAAGSNTTVDPWQPLLKKE